MQLLNGPQRFGAQGGFGLRGDLGAIIRLLVGNRPRKIKRTTNKCFQETRLHRAVGIVVKTGKVKCRRLNDFMVNVRYTIEYRENIYRTKAILVTVG